MKELIAISRRLCAAVQTLTFSAPVAVVYNPLDYAREPHETWLRRYAKKGAVLLVGMNPGPFGMAQTGVPFGDVTAVREFLSIEGRVGRPDREHSKRPVDGFACRRREVSGTRLWGWAKERFGDADTFFSTFFVANYCPLVFMGDTGANITPDKLPAGQQAALFDICDRALRDTAVALASPMVVGVGGFATRACERALAGLPVPTGTVLHPSPASPAANRGWAHQAEAQLKKMGVL